MGFPASKLEGVFRNHIDDVFKFLESKHKDRYKLYNLCSERHYDSSRFHNRVANFPFDDHNPPKMELIRPFCQDVQSWLDKDPDNVVAIHCKAGKGRTGVMICAFLIHSGCVTSADEALELYGQKRTRDRKGVTIPSQRRYVDYYEALVKQKLLYRPVSLTPVCISFSPLPLVNVSSSFYFLICQDKKEVFRSETLEAKKGAHAFTYYFHDSTPFLAGDVKIEFKYKELVLKTKTTFFSFWFNAFFVQTTCLSLPSPCLPSKGPSSGSITETEDSCSTSVHYRPVNGHVRLPLTDHQSKRWVFAM